MLHHQMTSSYHDSTIGPLINYTSFIFLDNNIYSTAGPDLRTIITDPVFYFMDTYKSFWAWVDWSVPNLRDNFTVKVHVNDRGIIGTKFLWGSYIHWHSMWMCRSSEYWTWTYTPLFFPNLYIQLKYIDWPEGLITSSTSRDRIKIITISRLDWSNKGNDSNVWESNYQIKKILQPLIVRVILEYLFRFL